MAGSFPMLAAYNPNYTTPKDDLHLYASHSVAKSDAQEDPLTTAPPQSDIPDTTRRPRGVSKSYRKLVFTDPVAFRYLEEDESTTVLARRHKLEGYELYVVEQWIVSRTHPTFTICTYTGDTSHSILVSVLAVPQDQSTWSKRLQVYFSAISQSYAREKETHLGALMVTNLSGFPSALNVISVPDGDVKKHREDFIVNEDLKRMGCAGRAAMGLQYPPVSTINKFHHMYRTNEKVPLYSSVMELVRFCQLSLVLYGKLESTYADGLLCDITETAVSEWWNEIGIDFHNVEPNDGILGPTTVSALLGLVIGAYNRLKETGSPVGKDPMDLSGMKRAIAHFQKANKMERTRRLDRATLDRLHRVTANKAEDEGLGVTRALKSTVAGLSGKGGEMLARGFGGGKEKAGISEVETLDIERLAQLVTGRSMKWLWQGKDRGDTTSGTAAPTDELNGRVFSTDDQGNFIWTSGAKEGTDQVDFVGTADTEDREKKSNRLKDAVGLAGNKAHGSRVHTDDEGSKQEFLSVVNGTKEKRDESRDLSTKRSSHSAAHEQFPPLARDLAEASIAPPKSEPAQIDEPQHQRNRDRTNTNLTTHRQVLRGLDHRGGGSPSKRRVQEALAEIRRDLKSSRYQNFQGTFKFEQPQTTGLRRSLSSIQLRSIQEGRSARLPRHLSFSIVSDSIVFQLPEEENSASDEEESQANQRPVSGLVKIRKEQLRQAQELGAKVFSIDRGIIPFAETRIRRVEILGQDAQGQLEELNSVYYQHLDDYQTLQATSTDLVAREKSSLNEAMRSIDMLGQKLDYEIDSLQSRMQEVEESVDDFERRVLDIEANVKALVARGEHQEHVKWYQRWFGLGKVQKQANQKEMTEIDLDEQEPPVLPGEFVDVPAPPS